MSTKQCSGCGYHINTNCLHTKEQCRELIRQMKPDPRFPTQHAGKQQK